MALPPRRNSCRAAHIRFTISHKLGEITQNRTPSPSTLGTPRRRGWWTIANPEMIVDARSLVPRVGRLGSGMGSATPTSSLRLKIGDALPTYHAVTSFCLTTYHGISCWA